MTPAGRLAEALIATHWARDDAVIRAHHRRERLAGMPDPFAAEGLEAAAGPVELEELRATG